MDDDKARAERAKAAMFSGAAAPNVQRASEDAMAFVNGVAAEAVDSLVIALQAHIAGNYRHHASRANLLCVVINAALLRMRADDEALTVELTKHLHDVMRTMQFPDDAEYLEAMKAIGVVLHQFAEIEERQMQEQAP